MSKIIDYAAGGFICTDEDMAGLLGDTGHFHDWFLVEIRGIADFQFATSGITYPPRGGTLALRLADGHSQVLLVLEGVVTFQMRSEPDAIQVCEGHVAVNGEISLRLDDTTVVARRASWSKVAYTSALVFGPAPSPPGTRSAIVIGDGWVQCPDCHEAWQHCWAVEPCPACRTVVSCVV